MAVRLQAGICQAPKCAAQTTCWVSHCYKATVSLIDVRHCWWPMAWNYKMSSVCQVNLQMWMFVLLSLLLHPVGEHCHLWACQHQHCKIVNRNQQGKNICCHQAIQFNAGKLEMFWVMYLWKQLQLLGIELLDSEHCHLRSLLAPALQRNEWEKTICCYWVVRCREAWIVLVHCAFGNISSLSISNCLKVADVLVYSFLCGLVGG